MIAQKCIGTLTQAVKAQFDEVDSWHLNRPERKLVILLRDGLKRDSANASTPEELVAGALLISGQHVARRELTFQAAAKYVAKALHDELWRAGAYKQNPKGAARRIEHVNKLEGPSGPLTLEQKQWTAKKLSDYKEPEWDFMQLIGG
jgi:hypothetical protein